MKYNELSDSQKLNLHNNSYFMLVRDIIMNVISLLVVALLVWITIGVVMISAKTALNNGSVLLSILTVIAFPIVIYISFRTIKSELIDIAESLSLLIAKIKMRKEIEEDKGLFKKRKKSLLEKISDNLDYLIFIIILAFIFYFI